MFILGLLSLLQILLLPGFLLLKAFRIRTQGFIQSFIYSFGISLSFNYFLVCFLVLLKIYVAPTIFIIFSLEIFVFIYFLIKGKIKVPFKKTIYEGYTKFLNYHKNLTGIHRLLFSFALLLLLFFTALIFVNSETTYYFFDTIRIKMWAQMWASDNFMIYSHYPQLTATNSSINYLFINNDSIDFFSKTIMPLFFIGILLIFLDLYFRRKLVVYLTGFILYSYILLVFYGILFISDLNNDIPVSFFGFLSYYVILTREKTKVDTQTVLLTAFFAVTAANTKLVGLYAVAISGLWILYYLYNNRSYISKKELINLFGLLALIYIIGLFWYLIFPFQMSQGVGASPYRPFDGLIDSFFYGLHLISVSFGKLFTILILIALIAGIFTKAKNIILFVISPLFFIWAFWYSYDCRNLSLIIPFVSYAAAMGLVYILKILRQKLNFFKIQHDNRRSKDNIFKPKPLYSVVYVIFLFALLFSINTKFIFNLGMDTAYFLRSFYFNFTTLVFTSELGYYRYVEYFVNTMSVFIVLIIIFYLLRKSKIKIYQLGLSLLGAIIITNFFISKDLLIKVQKNDKKLVEMHNLYFEMHSYLKNQPGTILTNSGYIKGMIFPDGAEVKYINDLNKDRLKTIQDITYVVLDKKEPGKFGKMEEIPGTYTTYINNNNYIFFRLLPN